jgi:hypothetical protein
MLAYIPYMDPMGYIYISHYIRKRFPLPRLLSAASLGVAGSASQCVSWIATEHGIALWRRSGGLHPLVVFPAESMGFTWIQWGVYIDDIDVPGWWFQVSFYFP